VLQSKRPILWLLFAGLGAASVVVAAYSLVRPRSSEGPLAAAPPDQGHSVSCLGYIEPEDGVMILGARSLSGQPSLVGDIRVKDGDRVIAGQIVAILDSKEQLEAVWHQAEARVELAQKRLTQVKTGAKPADVASQQAEVARQQAELANAQKDYQRHEKLHEERVTSQAELDLSGLLVDSKSQMLNQSKEQLKSLSEVRPIDVEVAETEVRVAVADAQRARAEFNQSIIRSPIQGRVIRINARPGEEVGPKGIMEVGKTDHMYVIAEVAEVDIARLQPGSHATISGDGLPKSITGVVEEIGWKVAKNDVLYVDPAAFSDVRVVEVKIRLEDSKSVERLIHGRVNVIIKQ
jgi:HlyD family secretion protein